MSTVLYGFGLVLVIEGLAIALAPLRLERALEMLAALGRDQRRAIGIALLAAGVAVLWLARRLA